MKETEAQAAILDYLAAKRVFAWRSNNLPVYDEARGIYRSLPKHTMRGVPDIIVIHDGRAIFLEVKSEKGKLSPYQEEFASRARDAGAIYHIVRSIDDVIAIGL